MEGSLCKRKDIANALASHVILNVILLLYLSADRVRPREHMYFERERDTMLCACLFVNNNNNCKSSVMATHFD